MTVDVGPDVDEEVDDLEWLDAARDLSRLLPVGRQRLRQFTQDSGPDARLLPRDLPVGQESLPNTPTVRGSMRREAVTHPEQQLNQIHRNVVRQTRRSTR